MYNDAMLQVAFIVRRSWLLMILAGTQSWFSQTQERILHLHTEKNRVRPNHLTLNFTIERTLTTCIYEEHQISVCTLSLPTQMHIHIYIYAVPLQDITWSSFLDTSWFALYWGVSAGTTIQTSCLLHQSLPCDLTDVLLIFFVVGVSEEKRKEYIEQKANIVI